MPDENTASTDATSFTVSIVLECHDKVVRGWPIRQWELAAILSDDSLDNTLEGPITIRTSDTVSQFMWKGLQIKLFVDAAEGYWYNLLSEVPFGFVVCDYDEEDDEAIPLPFLITASQDEAGAHLETDNLVLSGPLPANIRDQIEVFVVNNYVPEIKKKRKRRDWYQESIETKPRR